jgi:ElaB/YqjD/DUF883 family membrane-anchored ribosome-binding protein
MITPEHVWSKQEEEMMEKPKTGGERSVDAIRQDIAAKTSAVVETMGKLEDKFQATVDWRSYVSRYPYLSIGAAAGAGLLLSRFFRRKPSASERIVGAVSDVVHELKGDLHDSVKSLIWKEAAPLLFKGTVYGMISKAVVSYLNSRSANGDGDHQYKAPEARQSTTPL